MFSDGQVHVQVYKAVGLKCSEQVLEVMLLQMKLMHLWALSLGFQDEYLKEIMIICYMQ